MRGWIRNARRMCYPPRASRPWSGTLNLALHMLCHVDAKMPTTPRYTPRSPASKQPMKSISSNAFRKPYLEPERTCFYHNMARYTYDASIPCLLRQSLPNLLRILSISDAVANGFVSTSSIPASIARSICSALELAVVAMIGMCRSNKPRSSLLRISRAHVRPSITGISQSSSIMSNLILDSGQLCQ